MRKIAIVITEDHYNALGVIRSLGQKKIPVYLLLTTAKGKTYTDKSKYVTEVQFVSHDAKSIIDMIGKYSKNNSECYIYPLSDFSAELIDQNYDKFNTNVICPNMKGKMNYFQNKMNSKQLAEKHGMKTAPSLLLQIGSPFIWEIFPAIIKPVISQEGIKGDITIVDSLEELIVVVGEFEKMGYQQVLIEEYLTGKDEHMVEVLGCSCKEKVFIAGIIKKIREYPMGKGSTSFAEIVHMHEGLNLDSVISFIKETRFDGLFDMEFKYVNGTCYFIECNYRNGAPSYALTQVGCNLPYNWMMSRANGKFESIKYSDKQMFFMCEQTDLLNALKRELPLKEWINQYRKANKIFMIKDDLKPVFNYYISFLKMLVVRLCRRR